MVYKVFNKTSSGGAVTHAWLEDLTTRDKSAIENKIILNQPLSDLIHASDLNLKIEKGDHLLKTIFGMLILQICN